MGRAPHLTAAVLAAGVAAGLFFIGFDAFHLERRLSRLTAPEILEVKDQGISLQEAAFGDRHLLPVYGSSEFRNDSPYAGRVFFSHAPTGFEIFAVGKAGAKTLIIAERLAALGKNIRGRKVVIILSPTWFISPPGSAGLYDGNFSALQAAELAFDSPISLSLKRRFAREMLKYPETLAGHELLRLELDRLAAGSHSVEDRLIAGLGRSEAQFLQLLDRCETVFALSGEMWAHPGELSDRAAAPKARPDWPHLFADATAFSRTNSYASAAKRAESRLVKADERLSGWFAGKDAAAFEEMMRRSYEWRHLDILLRTLHELGAEPLFISIPLNATAFEAEGVTREERALYYANLRRQIGAFHFPVVTFQEHETDPTFFGDSVGHPSAKGWMTFNRTINAFYHGKLALPAE